MPKGKIRLLAEWFFDQFILPVWEALASDRPEKGKPGDGPAPPDA